MNPTAKHGQRIGIIGAMEAEVALLRDSLNGLEIHRFGKNFVVYTGQFAGKDIALCQSGIGKVNAAIATTLLKEHFAPDVVINTGSAGGIGGGLKVGDVVVGTHIMHHDVDVTAFGYQHGQVPQLPAAFACDETLVAAAEKAACTFQAARVMHGLIVSGDSFINSKTAIGQIHARLPQPLAVEMEAAAIAQTCYQLETPFVVIRAISDSAEDSASVSFEEFLEVAAKHSAQMVQQMIQAL